MIQKRAGFTVVELLIVMIVGSVLATIVSQSLGAYMRRRALDDSRAAVFHMAARARALGIDRGMATLDIDPARDTVTLVQGGDTLEVLDIAADYGADLIGDAAISICYSSRGYALSACTSFGANQTLELEFQGETVGLVVRPLGQLEVL
ncbi:MAG TPA: type II secretion system protein [Longimicrobiales bacterium]|nr:type II secretion system protein [Longimicrobiales bacterium]